MPKPVPGTDREKLVKQAAAWGCPLSGLVGLGLGALWVVLCGRGVLPQSWVVAFGILTVLFMMLARYLVAPVLGLFVWYRLKRSGVEEPPADPPEGA
jgi:hypothetical protein